MKPLKSLDPEPSKTGFKNYKKSSPKLSATATILKADKLQPRFVLKDGSFVKEIKENDITIGWNSQGVTECDLLSIPTSQVMKLNPTTINGLPCSGSSNKNHTRNNSFTEFLTNKNRDYMSISLGQFRINPDPNFWKQWNRYCLINNISLSIRMRIEGDFGEHSRIFFIEKKANSSSTIEYIDDLSDDDNNVNIKRIKKKTNCYQRLKDSCAYLLTIRNITYPLEFEIGLYGLISDKVTIRQLHVWFSEDKLDIHFPLESIRLQVSCSIEFDPDRWMDRQLESFRRFHRKIGRFILCHYGRECSNEFMRRSQRNACKQCCMDARKLLNGREKEKEVEVEEEELCADRRLPVMCLADKCACSYLQNDYRLPSYWGKLSAGLVGHDAGKELAAAVFDGRRWEDRNEWFRQKKEDTVNKYEQEFYDHYFCRQLKRFCPKCGQPEPFQQFQNRTEEVEEEVEKEEEVEEEVAVEVEEEVEVVVEEEVEEDEVKEGEGEKKEVEMGRGRGRGVCDVCGEQFRPPLYFDVAGWEEKTRRALDKKKRHVSAGEARKREELAAIRRAADQQYRFSRPTSAKLTRLLSPPPRQKTSSLLYVDASALLGAWERKRKRKDRLLPRYRDDDLGAEIDHSMSGILLPPDVPYDKVEVEVGAGGGGCL